MRYLKVAAVFIGAFMLVGVAGGIIVILSMKDGSSAAEVDTASRWATILALIVAFFVTRWYYRRFKIREDWRKSLEGKG